MKFALKRIISHIKVNLDVIDMLKKMVVVGLKI